MGERRLLVAMGTEAADRTVILLQADTRAEQDQRMIPSQKLGRRENETRPRKPRRTGASSERGAVTEVQTSNGARLQESCPSPGSLGRQGRRSAHPGRSDRRLTDEGGRQLAIPRAAK